MLLRLRFYILKSSSKFLFSLFCRVYFAERFSFQNRCIGNKRSGLLGIIFSNLLTVEQRSLMFSLYFFQNHHYQQHFLFWTRNWKVIFRGNIFYNWYCCYLFTEPVCVYSMWIDLVKTFYNVNVQRFSYVAATSLFYVVPPFIRNLKTTLVQRRTAIVFAGIAEYSLTYS